MIRFILIVSLLILYFHLVEEQELETHHNGRTEEASQTESQTNSNSRQ